MKDNSSGENYLKAIYALQKASGFVRSVDVAEHMGVSKPSVSRAVRQLRERGFLVMNDDYSLRLTETGHEFAVRIYEHYQYFTKRLTVAGVDPEVAEAEACRMEHTISDESFQILKDRKEQECPFADTCNFKSRKDRTL